MAAFLKTAFDRVGRWSLNRQAVKAADHNDFEEALRLVDQGADVNYIGSVLRNSAAALWREESNVGWAALQGNHISAFKEFLDRGLDPNLCIAGPNSGRLLTYALDHRYSEAAKMLIEKGADVTYQDGLPLRMAQARGLTDIAAMIREGLLGGLEAKAHANKSLTLSATSSQSATPLSSK